MLRFKNGLATGKGNERVEARLNDMWTRSDQGRVQKLSHSARCRHQVRRIPTRSGTLPGPFLIEPVNVGLSSMVSQLDWASKWDRPGYPGIRYAGYQQLHISAVSSNIHVLDIPLQGCNRICDF